jgi:hypothetical protein
MGAKQLQICKAFATLVRAKGPNGHWSITMYQLGRALGCSESNIYRYFRSKDLIIEGALKVGYITLADVVPASWFNAALSSGDEKFIVDSE